MNILSINNLNKILVSLSLVISINGCVNCNENELQIIKKLSVASLANTETEHTFVGQILYDINGNVLYDPIKNGKDYTWYQTNYRISETDPRIVPQYNGRDIYVYEYWYESNSHNGHTDNLLAKNVSQASSDTNIYGLYTLGISESNVNTIGGYSAIKSLSETSAKVIPGYKLTPIEYWKKSSNNFVFFSADSAYSTFGETPKAIKLVLKADSGEFIYELKWDSTNSQNLFRLAYRGESCQVYQLCTFDDSGKFEQNNVKDLVSFWKRSESTKDSLGNIIPKYTKNDGTCVDIYLMKKAVDVTLINNQLGTTMESGSITKQISNLDTKLSSNIFSINELLKWHKEEINLFHLWWHEIDKRIKKIKLRENELNKKEKELKVKEDELGKKEIELNKISNDK